MVSIISPPSRGFLDHWEIYFSFSWLRSLLYNYPVGLTELGGRKAEMGSWGLRRLEVDALVLPGGLDASNLANQVRNQSRYVNSSNNFLILLHYLVSDLVSQRFSAVNDGNDIMVGSGLMLVTNEGVVNWFPPINLLSWCNTRDINHWPNDEHTCNLTLACGRLRDLLEIYLEIRLYVYSAQNNSACLI